MTFVIVSQTLHYLNDVGVDEAAVNGLVTVCP